MSRLKKAKCFQSKLFTKRKVMQRLKPLSVTKARYMYRCLYRGADKSLARPGRKQATATEDFDFRISYL